MALPETRLCAFERTSFPKKRVQKHIDRLRSDKKRLVGLIEDLADPDPCYYDHHGYCQAHAWLTHETPCPHRRAKILLQNKGEQQ